MKASKAATAARVETLISRCRDSGLNVTPQRIAVFRALADAHDHPSPETLFRRVRGDLPSLSLATIYKSLDALVRLGLAREVHVGGAAKRYDANLEPHHHLVCTRCSRVSDLYDARYDSIAAPRPTPGFRPRSVSVQVLGVCAACASRKAGP